MKSRLALPFFLLILALGGLAFWQLSGGGGSRGGGRDLGSFASDEDPDGDSRGQPTLGRSATGSAEGAGAAPSSTRLAQSDSEALAAATQASAVSKVSVRGMVLDSEGRPLESAEVSGSAREPSVWNAGDEAPQGGVVTASDGSFLLSDEQPGPFYLRVLADGFAPFARAASALPNEPEFSLAPVQMELGLTLAGVVLGPDELPFEGAKIFSRSSKKPVFGPRALLELASSDAKGHFLVNRLAAGKWTLVVQSESYPEGILQGQTARPGTREEGLVIRLGLPIGIAGKVLGIPEASQQSLVVSARLVDSEDPWAWAKRQAPILDDGSFALVALAAGQEYDLAVYGQGKGRTSFFGRALSPTVRVRSGEVGLELSFIPGSSLTFQVVDAASKEPLEGLVVKAGMGWLAPLIDDNGQPQNDFPGGRVTFDGLRAQLQGQPCQLEISSVGYRNYTDNEIELGAGVQLDLGIIELQPIPVVRVTVLDRLSGLPIEGARVSMRQESNIESSLSRLGYAGAVSFQTVHSGEEATGITDAEGVAVISSFEDQVSSIRVRAAGYAPSTMRNIHLPLRKDFGQTIEMGQGGQVTVSVYTSEGSPVGGLQISRHRVAGDKQDLAWRSARSKPQVTDSEGATVFLNLEPGEHRFQLSTARMGGMGMGRSVPAAEQDPGVSLQVTEGGEHEIQLAAPEICSLVGRILEGGQPLAGTHLRLVRQGDKPRDAFELVGVELETSASDGSYRLEGAQPGNYELVLEHPTRSMSASFAVELFEGENEATIDLDVAIIEGRVVSPAGDPLEGVRVQAQRAAGGGQADRNGILLLGGSGMAPIEFGSDRKQITLTDAEGHFRLRGVQAGVELLLLGEGKNVQPLRTESFLLGSDEIRDTADLVMELAGSIRLRLLLDGEKLAYCSVLATWQGELGEGNAAPEPFHDLVQEGEGVLGSLRPGTWHVVADAVSIGVGSPPAHAEVDIDVRAGEEFFQILHLERKQ